MSVDAFPNYTSGRLVLSGANTFTTQTITLPLNRIRVGGAGRTTILEFLWIDVTIVSVDLLANSDEVAFSFSSGAVPTSVQNISNPDVIAEVLLFAHVGASPGTALVRQNFRMDLQSQDGHGQLIAVDRINVMGNSSGLAAAAQFRWRIYYRFVNVPIEEFVGIVQSQGN